MKEDFFANLIGSKIVDVNRTCDLVMFTFELANGRKIFFHIQCFIRIFDANKLIVCTQDMLRRSVTLKTRQKFDWAKTGGTLYDDTISEYKEKLFSTCVKSFSFHNQDLIIFFANDMRLEILIHITESDDPRYSENYRVFDEDEDKGHFVV